MNLKNTKFGTISDINGNFSFSASKGKYSLLFTYIGYKTIKQEIKLSQDITLNISFTQSETDLEEVEVSTTKTDENVKSTQMGVVQLEMSEIKKIPAFMGEVDVLKTIQLLPGIKNAGDGNTGFYVRGGGPDQNLILLDGANIYNASHLLGFFSVFNGDAVKSVDLYKGNMPAQYGGRLSSVLDISLKEGDDKAFHVDGGIGVIASRLTIQGPLIKNKAAFIISARRTYLDALVKPYIDNSDFKGTSYFFYDLNAKLNYTINNKNRLFLSGYYGRDKFKFVDAEGGFNADIPWGNAAATLRWNHIFSPKLFSNMSLIFTNYDFSFGAAQQDFDLIIKSGITDYGFKYDLNYYPNSRHNVKVGLNYIFHTFVPTTVSAQQGSTVFDFGKKIKLYSHDVGVYVSDDWEITQKLQMNIGLRFTNFTQIGPFTRYKKDNFGVINDTVNYNTNDIVANYNGLEPRLSARYSLTKKLSLKASYSRNFQYIHLATISSVSLPTDVWMPSTEIIKPQESNQYALGIFRNFKENIFETSIEVYYKTMSNQIEYAEGSQPSDNIYDNPDNAFTYGKGWAYGAEFFIKKNRGKLTGWIGYTLSWTWRQFDQINYGQKFLAKYDRRHDVSIVLMYDASKKWNFGMVWIYGSGNRGTLPNGFFLYEGSLSNDYGLRNSYQFIPYHRLDLNVTFTPDRTKKLEKRKRTLINQYIEQGKDTSNIQVTKSWMKNFSNSFTLSLFNVYNRYNPYFIYLTREGDFNNGSLKVGAKQVSLFPILPSLTWNFKF
ncbi:TonB-dependent receptor [Aurantibacillus circumpalustris]|uniref:TonB-dependent receptor n=1 Tax=Aurantibacillus circumpalustris TaxID=3036359 RepID=UPI0037BF74F9